jgi:hypothetical protein
VWYVAFRRNGATTMRVFKTRPLAIRAACNMIGDPNRQDVQVGPMVDAEPALSGDELRRICAMIRGQGQDRS